MKVVVPDSLASIVIIRHQLWCMTSHQAEPTFMKAMAEDQLSSPFRRVRVRQTLRMIPPIVFAGHPVCSRCHAAKQALVSQTPGGAPSQLTSSLRIPHCASDTTLFGLELDWQIGHAACISNVIRIVQFQSSYECSANGAASQTGIDIKGAVSRLAPFLL